MKRNRPLITMGMTPELMRQLAMRRRLNNVPYYGLPAPGPRRTRYRRATGALQSNTGGKTITKTQTKRKRKRPFNLVREVKKLKKDTAIERNKAKCTYTRSQLISSSHTHLANRYGNTIINVGTVTDAEAALSAVKIQDPTAGEAAWSGVNSSTKTTMRFSAKIYLKNNDNFPTNVVIYDCTATENHNQNIQQVFDDYHTNVPAGNGSTVEHQGDLRHNLGDVRNMHEFFKLQRTHIYLKPGDEYTFYVKAGGEYDPSINDTETVSFLKNFSHSVYIRTYGVPCHDSTTTTLVGTTPLNQLDIVRWEYEKVIVNGLGNTQTRRVAGASSAFGDLGNMATPVCNGVDVVQEVA